MDGKMAWKRSVYTPPLIPCFRFTAAILFQGTGLRCCCRGRKGVMMVYLCLLIVTVIKRITIQEKAKKCESTKDAEKKVGSWRRRHFVQLVVRLRTWLHWFSQEWLISWNESANVLSHRLTNPHWFITPFHLLLNLLASCIPLYQITSW